MTHNTELAATMTPMMQQWVACKKQAADAILLFRLGDFYEAFHEDAVLLSKELYLTLTQRQEIPMAGVPAANSDIYIDKLVAKGYRVAIAEQIEATRGNKGLMERKVVRIVTPGTVMQSTFLLKEKHNNFLASLSKVNGAYGVAVIDMSTGQFYAMEATALLPLLTHLSRIAPKELLISKRLQKEGALPLQNLLSDHGITVAERDDWLFKEEVAKDILIAHFNVTTLEGLSIKQKVGAQVAAGALINYISNELSLNVKHLSYLAFYETKKLLTMDQATFSHLEIMHSQHDRSDRTSLLFLLDQTETPMGARLLQQWLMNPTIDLETIQRRQTSIKSLLNYSNRFQELHKILASIHDLERLLIRVETSYSPKDLYSLLGSFLHLPSLKIELALDESAPFQNLEAALEEIPYDLFAHWSGIFTAAPPVKMTEGAIFASGYSESLDQLRAIKATSSQWLADYQIRLREETQIKNLKIGHSRTTGFYIEVSKTQAKNAPMTWEKRQDLTNSERFISTELKEFEYKFLKAEDQSIALEQQLFLDLRQHLLAYADSIKKVTSRLAEFDLLLALAVVAYNENYVCPIVDQSNVLCIKEGRHPVIEKLQADHPFTPNDLDLSQDQRFILLTGPNMGGKSTYIRQTALIAFLAHIGSFVPAAFAHIGLLDRIFSRIGASDNLAKGHSTFQVEMAEVAYILNHATERSLVILDEVGRGTGTLDGIAIAQAVCEFLLQKPEGIPKVLFATHYWELTHLEDYHPCFKNYEVLVQENSKGLAFLHKIVAGRSDKSYGLHIAQHAGIPMTVIDRAHAIRAVLAREELITV